MIGQEDREGSLEYLENLCDIASAEKSLAPLKEKFSSFNISDEDQVDMILKAAIQKDIQQILSSQTLERAKHYVKRLRNSIASFSGSPSQGININLWKGYDHILTGSLWNIGPRVSNSSHKAWYWGNFVPQIPFQLISRYTAPGDWVLDPFCGSGTTIVEATKLGRNSLGIELNPDVIVRTDELLASIRESNGVRALTELGNSLSYDYASFVAGQRINGFKLAILHPPYWDIIRFSENKDDLSTSSDLEDFTGRLATLVKAFLPSMTKGGHVGLVIGDMYRNGEIIPLGFRTMEAVLGLGLKLRGIIVKDIQNTRAKRTSENLWRYRALKSGFYVFKHEYVFVFRVPE